MKTKITYLTTVWTIIAIILPSSAQAGVLDWFWQNKIEFQSPFVSPAGAPTESRLFTPESAVKNTELPIISYSAVVGNANHLTCSRFYSAKTRVFYVPATAYSSTPDQTDSTPFITASGTHVRQGVVAANFLPLGTVIRIPEVYGEQTFVVEDRMHARYVYRIDIWFPSRDEARAFGFKMVKIEIIS